MTVVYTAGANATPPAGTEIETTDTPGSGKRQTIDPRPAVKRVEVSVTTTATAYEDLDSVGGNLTFANVAREAGGSVRIEALQLVDEDQQLAAFRLLLFSAAPTATDEAAFDPTDAQLLDFIGAIQITTDDYLDLTDNAVAHVDCGLTCVLGASDDLHAVLVCEGSTPTFASTSSVHLALTVVQD